MKRENKIHPTIVPLLDLDSLYTSVINEVTGKSSLKSKYLYLGWHGANSWKGVDSSYRINVEGLQLINDYFLEIDEIVRSTSNQKKYNLISLGAGTCEEDVRILDVLLKRNRENIPSFKIFIVDISIDLLTEGLHRLASKINSHPRLRIFIQDLIPINIDIDHLYGCREIIRNYKRKSSETNLFHLLGLTLGNNDENIMLSSIYRTMEFNDYLLLGLDFCADDIDVLTQTKEQYHGNNVTEAINKYLCSPLIFAANYEKDEKTNHIRFSISDFKDLEIEFSEEKSISDVPDSTSFVYNYKFKDANNDSYSMRACFSNKYKSQEFKKYIEEDLPKKEIHFEIIKGITAFGDKSTGQHLVLLKKISKQVSKEIVRKSAQHHLKEIRCSVDILKKTTVDLRSSAVKAKDDKELIELYDRLIKELENPNKYDVNLQEILELINIYYNDNRLKNISIVQSLLKMLKHDTTN